MDYEEFIKRYGEHVIVLVNYESRTEVSVKQLFELVRQIVNEAIAEHNLDLNNEH